MSKPSFLSIIKLPLNAVTDIKFEKSLGLDISRVFYVISLGVQAVSAIAALGWGLLLGLGMLLNTTTEYDYYSDSWEDKFSPNGLGFLVILATLIVVPVVTVLGVLATRWVYEIYNAFIQTAQNTKK